MGGNWALAWPAGAITLAFATTGAAQAPSYTFTPIDVPGATSTAARSINDANQIVGSFTDSAGTHGFVLSGGSFSTIDVPEATASFGTFASGVNDADQIVGDYFVATGQQHGFLDMGGTFTAIDVPGVLHSTAALDINNSSWIVGYYDMKIGFLEAGGSFTTIDVPGSQSTYPFGINNNFPVQIVGWFGDTGLGQECTARNKKATHGFLDSGGNFTTIDVPGATQTCAYGINDHSHIVGSFTDSAGTHGFLASPDDGTVEGGFLGIGTRR